MPYDVIESPYEVQKMIEDCTGNFQFIWLERFGEPQVALRIDKISAMYRNT